MRVDVLTIFPAYLAPLELSLVGKARAAGLLDVRVHDLRDWTTDRHRTVDDTPFGGGAGMVMRPDVWGVALDEVLGLGPADDTPGAPGAADAGGPDPDLPAGAVPERGAPEPAALPVLLVPTPSGRPFDQAFAVELAQYPHLVLACGRYEGIDGRVVEHYATRVHVEEVSLGDYVLNGGEVAALAIIEAVARLLPGVVGNPHSLVEESHGDSGLLEYPVYTKPAQWRGRAVPEELLSGHHARIARWRRDQALRRTAERRPDLVSRLDVHQLDAHDRAVLADLGWVVRDGVLIPDPGVSARPEHVAD